MLLHLRKVLLGILLAKANNLTSIAFGRSAFAEHRHGALLCFQFRSLSLSRHAATFGLLVQPLRFGRRAAAVGQC